MWVKGDTGHLLNVFLRLNVKDAVSLAISCIFVGNWTAWWRHQMETFSALLALCAGNSPVTGDFPSQRLLTQSLDVFFDLCLNKRLTKQSWGWWFEIPLRSFWHHRNGILISTRRDRHLLSKTKHGNRWRMSQPSEKNTCRQIHIRCALTVLKHHAGSTGICVSAFCYNLTKKSMLPTNFN